jgi:dihydroorotase-like cyclic amidohydrolase
MIKFPGLIDPHVHLRDPGQTEKEDFYTGTIAALAGGYTTVIDMPNNTVPITTEKLLLGKSKIAQKKIVCDVGFHFGSLGNNLNEFHKVQKYVAGLKIYFNQTTGGYVVTPSVFKKICEAWPVGKPILVHAEEDILEEILAIADQYNQKIHVCHVSSDRELQLVLEAKKRKQQVTCGVTPHHLFLTKKDGEKLGNFSKVKPYLKSEKDVSFLWNHLYDIDVIESDHAPHTIEEKESQNPPFGLPGLETTLPLLLTAMHEGKISQEEIIYKCYTKPKAIFSIPSQPDTYSEVDENEEWTIENDKLFTQAKWSPFDGWKITGRVKRVVIRGKKVFENGKMLADKGSGKILTEE